MLTSKTKRKKATSWTLIDDVFAVKSVDLFSKGSKHIPCRVFVNDVTGELKLFSIVYFERLGANKIIEIINKKS